mgnify:CR=1 FL=1
MVVLYIQRGGAGQGKAGLGEARQGGARSFYDSKDERQNWYNGSFPITLYARRTGTGGTA